MRIGSYRLAYVILSFCALCASAAETQPDILIGTKPSEVMMAKITVSDLRKSYDFYTNGVGLKAIETLGNPKPPIDDPNAPLAEVCLNFTGSFADPYVCLLKIKGL